MRDRARGPNDFAVLKRQVARAGLLRRAPGWYRGKVASTLLLVAVAWMLVPFSATPLAQVAAASFLAFAFCQVGFLAHDAAHHQILHSARANRILALALFDGVVGLSMGWWLGKHGRHHVHPNRVGYDPDVAPGVLAFTEAQALDAAPGRRWIIRHQAALFLPMLLLEGFSLRWESLEVVLRGDSRARRTEAVVLTAHVATYLGVLVALLGGWGALLFVVAHHVAMGVYLGLVFAPNHIGMPVPADDARYDFARRQILTTRNVRPSRVIDFLFGGLNYQIEHHLFPSMPRPHLRRVRPIVRRFCQQRGIAYRETGLLESYAEVLAGLHRSAAPLRRSAATPGRRGNRRGAPAWLRERDLRDTDDLLPEVALAAVQVELPQAE